MLTWWRRKSRERDLDRELRSHLDLEAEDQQAAGLAPDQARYAARRAFGTTTTIREATREMRGWTSFERFWQDRRTLRVDPMVALRYEDQFADISTNT
jgi:hypothetical protein